MPTTPLPSPLTASVDVVAGSAQLLSNGRYHVMVTDEGTGFSRWNQLSITRWRLGDSAHPQGSFCYLRDRASGLVWSTTIQPASSQAACDRSVFEPGRATLGSRRHAVSALTEIAVAPDDDVELRCLQLTNHSNRTRTLDATSYAEIVLESASADAAHPAFGKLFIETELLPSMHAILCTRRAQSPGAPEPWMFHMLRSGTTDDGEVSYETDRMRFVGRGRDQTAPACLDTCGPLGGGAGAVLDPVVSIRWSIVLPPGGTATMDLVSGVASSRQACLALAQRYQLQNVVDHAWLDAGPHARAELATAQVSVPDAALYAHLAWLMFGSDRRLRCAPERLAQNHSGASGLWAHGISGDVPIVLVSVNAPSHSVVVAQLAQAHAYWRRHGIAVDLVVLIESATAAARAGEDVVAMVSAAAGAIGGVKPGGVFVLDASTMSVPDLTVLHSCARIDLNGRDGSLAAQLEARCGSTTPSAFQAEQFGDETTASVDTIEHPPRAPELEFDNGLGGFTADGREYVVTVTPQRMTPLPWVNVLANPTFGTLVSESGSATTWSENAQQFRLTPWSNDPVSDPNTEALYIRDDDSGRYWSPTLLPCRSWSTQVGPYVARHGFGYSTFEHRDVDIDSTMTVYVAIDAPVKFICLRLHNRSDALRRVSITGYVEWVLGDERSKTSLHIGTDVDAECGALFARNPYATDFAGRTAFFDVDGIGDVGNSICCDRTEFIGPCGTLGAPQAMSRPRLSGSAGWALDPCAAVRLPLTLQSGQTRDIVFRLGAGVDPAHARALVRRWRGAAAADDALAAVREHWTETLGKVQVQTPDRSFDVLVNGWLTYQTLACRFWARNAFYQSSGAFGFRDQLQDAMALVQVAPALVRAHLLLCAARQFEAGDVQHWWHPPTGRGVRTHCSDDYLWLPLAMCRYVTVSGDSTVLDEQVAYLSGSPLGPLQASNYEQPYCSDRVATLYAHGVCAIEHGLRFGAHGLPLMGGGDWNDGMNLVGAAGRGESVWLAFFLYAVLIPFAALARQRGDLAFAERCVTQSLEIRQAIETHAWDGAWYRRGWFDDGSPLGTSANTECRIDSIAQSWAVLSGASPPQRARRAMESVDEHLVHAQARLIELLAPPFDRSDPSPGYIQGYVPGVRENGGQYTHAAVWVAMAYAALGDADRAWEAFTMLSPIRHGDSPAAVSTYQVEPYVMAGDVYSLPPHTGRGGWTWYTGSAGWMLRFSLESLLGVQVRDNQLRVDPCVPPSWEAFQVRYRHGQTHYHIQVHCRDGTADGPTLELDGEPVSGRTLTLVDDHRDHHVIVRSQRTGESA